MANTDLIIPIVVAAIGLLGTLVSLAFSLRADRKVKRLELQAEHSQTVADLTEKYSQPILVAAYDLQQRLYELVEYPISRQHLSKAEGLDDLKIFTCYLLAQYLVFTHILRTQTGYLSFTENKKLKKLRKVMYMIDEELDRRRDSAGMNVGVWPAARVLVCERMIFKRGDLNDALDGGFGIEVKGFDEFRKEWPTQFRQPMGYFCEWIDEMLEGRLEKKPYSDAPMRVLQHLLVDLIKNVDTKEAYITRDIRSLKCKRSPRGCDCEDDRGGRSLDQALEHRRESRLNDAGLWSSD
jgi:hypothetical protein